jgi:hypothetical protein
MPSTVSPPFVSDLYGAAVISHSPIMMPIVPGAQIINMGSIMVYNDPAATPTPDLRLRVIADPAEIPNIFGILLETVESGATGIPDNTVVNACVDRKGSFRADQLEVGANAPVSVAACEEQLRSLGIFLEASALVN